MNWTAWNEPAAERAAGQLMEGLRDQLLQAWGRLLEGILVVGGYGRGEGSLLRTRMGSYRPWNDVDLMLLLRDGAAIPPGWHQQADAWAAHWDLDGVDLAWAAEADWRQAPRSLFHVEARAGHRILWGSGAAAQRLPRELGQGDCLREAHRLLSNRGFGLVLLAFPDLLGPRSQGQGFRLNALLKAHMAPGDARLLAGCRLPLRYAERPAALRAMGAPAEMLQAHADAVEMKLRPTEEWVGRERDFQAEVREAARMWLAHGPLALARTDAAAYPAYVARRLGSWRRKLRRAVAGGGAPLGLEPDARLEAGLPLLMAGLGAPEGWNAAPLAALWPEVVRPDSDWNAAAGALCALWVEDK
jgi:hypothetical protein